VSATAASGLLLRYEPGARAQHWLTSRGHAPFLASSDAAFVLEPVVRAVCALVPVARHGHSLRPPTALRSRVYALSGRSVNIGQTHLTVSSPYSPFSAC
jgi:hypothetical protein